jgi:phosphocarrier protein FPr
MGSAILSAEMACELLGDMARNVVICSDPLVEGTMAAAVQASLGRPLAEVRREAQGALQAKRTQLDAEGDNDDGGSHKDDSHKANAAPIATTLSAASAPKASLSRTFVIDLAHGLHARPAARLVRAASGEQITAIVSNRTKKKGPVSARSLNQLSSLEIGSGDEMLVEISGPEPAPVMQRIQALVDDRFGEAEVSAESVASQKQSPGETIGLSEGYAIGPVWLVEDAVLDVAEELITDVEAEVARLEYAIECVNSAITERALDFNAATSSAAPELEIFEAHLALLSDPDLIESSVASIRARKVCADGAWTSAVRSVVARFEALEDPHLQMRSTDVKDIGMQVLSALNTDRETATVFPQKGAPVIVMARELTPSQTVSLDSAYVAGIVTELGGATSHTAILARALGIPAVGGFPYPSHLAADMIVAIDGAAGTVTLNPDKTEAEALCTRRNSWITERDDLRKGAHIKSETADNVMIPVLANVAGFNDVAAAIANGAEGIGLFRTEFLYVNRPEPPTVDEQITYYSSVFEGMKGQPVTVRTFDVGGDKKIPYFKMEPEANPFLGVRGIRLYEDHQDLFLNQIEAILRAADDYEVSIMLPMVTKLDELVRAIDGIASVHDRLVREDVKHRWPVAVGVMIETPASVLLVEQLADVADFFSIGTNDLTQYILAADRGSRRLAGFLDALEPSVLRAIQQVSMVGHQKGVSVSICGELGAQIEAIPLLVGLGIDKISANSSSVPAIKAAIRRTDRARISDKAAEIVRSARSVREVRERLVGLADCDDG